LRHAQGAPVDLQPETWIPLGPRNVGGAVRALAQNPAHPATLYAGSAQGGLWKTEDDGYSWRPVGEPELIAPVSAVALAPSNPRVLYAGTGEVAARLLGGRGVFRSGNAGGSWTRL